MSHPLVQAVHHFLKPFQTAEQLWVGFSGGLDSTVLLHLLVELKRRGLEERPIFAIHINHQLSPHAGDWQRHCEAQCERLQVAFYGHRVDVSNKGRGLEDAAREARYRLFSELVPPSDALLLGHHLDDQAETMLLRMMRGAGPKGLAAMSESRTLENGSKLLRPLLNQKREQLLRWASSEGLSWVEDDSNESEAFDRNFLRLQVMPLLESRWPDFAHRWRQTGELCRQADDQVRERAVQDVALCDVRSERWGWSLDLRVLQQLSVYQRGNVLRQLLESKGLSAPDQVHLKQLENQLIFPREDAKAEVRWGGVSLRHYQGRLYLLPLDFETQVPLGVCWDLQQDLKWPAGTLSAQKVCGGLTLSEGDCLEVTTRQPGDRCKPAGRGGSQTLKKLLQESRLEPWLRDLVPVLRLNGVIVAVADLWVCDGFYESDKPGYELSWGSPKRE